LDKNTQLLIVLAGVFVLCRIPFVGKVLKVFNTLIHESGHALMSLLTSGEVISVDLFYNTEGTATTTSKHWFGKFFTSIAGYVASSACAFLFFYFIKYDQYNWIIYSLLVLAIINLIFWVRNLYGILWLLVMTAIIILLLYWKNGDAVKYVTMIISGVVLSESLTSAAIIFYISLSKPKQAGDATNLQKLTYLPAVVWGLFFFVQALFFTLLTLRLYLEFSVKFLE
jgi:hypothetical protein